MILSKRPEIERFLASPQPGIRAVLLYGRDRGVVRERADGLAAKIAKVPDDPFDVALVTDTDVSEDSARLEGELKALSMTGGRRLVRLRMTTEKASIDKLAAEALGEHAAGEFNPDAFFLIEAGGLGRESTLRKTAEKAAGAACIPCYEDEPGDVARLVREGLAKDKLSLNSEALDLFVSRLPHERGVVRAEIERLALFLGPGSARTVGPEELEPYLGVEPEASLSDAAADAFGGRGKNAQAGLRRAFGEGEAGAAAVRATGMHLGKLRRALTLAKSGADMKEAAKAAGVFWKQEREFLRQVRAWSLQDLDLVQPDVLNADRACKTAGSQDLLIAERLLLSIAQRGRRLGL
ncbi:MAG TPA: DNA polymerase III subunit delta [Caulobacteraceae bacterium]|jgi:DNA polymerase-3 subunit delta